MDMEYTKIRTYGNVTVWYRVSSPVAVCLIVYGNKRFAHVFVGWVSRRWYRKRVYFVNRICLR